MELVIMSKDETRAALGILECLTAHLLVTLHEEHEAGEILDRIVQDVVRSPSLSREYRDVLLAQSARWWVVLEALTGYRDQADSDSDDSDWS